MIIYDVLVILFLHLVCDFFLQSREMANNKSKSIYWLSAHVLTYCVPWLLILSFFFEFSLAIKFVVITFVGHFITDYITSKLTTHYYEKKKIGMFFNIIGIDQFLHYIQLLVTFKILFL